MVTTLQGGYGGGGVFGTLYGKTFLILTCQLGITWMGTAGLLAFFRQQYRAGAAWISARRNTQGQLDLSLDWSVVEPYFWPLAPVSICTFLVLLFRGIDPLTISIPLFVAWSLLTGFQLAFCLIVVDENLGSRILALTGLITCGAAVVGLRPDANFSFLQIWLLLALLLLICLGCLRILYRIPSWAQRISTVFGIVVFSTYLIFDFNRLQLASRYAGTNSWERAAHLSIDIYLDVINLFLKLLELFSHK